jgi:hypothetical protein
MTPENREPLGSKKKLWFRDPNSTAPRTLCKYNRPGTGEDWSEKIAAELAQLLGLPHATVELASFEGERGAAVVDFTDNEQFALVHGNEILEFVDSSYPKRQRYGAMAHTVNAVVSALDGVDPQAVKDTVDCVPKAHMSDTAKAFACALLACNAKLLGAR